ncbi:N-terminal acetyltransferase A, auxiliary subunit [Trema orientale]|uniref:N-terminal acetyltransferase A, auxiliary subunit n=1 Tax=Trema orientale TaxID=63057 RepID=A0A2P5E9L4_TREOI|nr:N-terminal acetyltransferase A, auxiliary subunit [Trema orientale]
MGGREEPKLSAAKRSYKSAKAEGNHQEEAKWANVIGHILKDRGEYVEALRWLRLDYEISFKFLTQRHCFATCQSLGEVYLLLKDFKEALSYQKKHLELAKDANDLAEQQRANTQLGRTYYEMLLSFKDDNNLVMSAKKYFNTAMELAQALKDNPPANNCSFLEEYIDAHNNIGMLEMELDNFEEAQKILSKGLEICDEEEVMGDDAGRSRLHHNLGFVYMELRMWVKAKYHMEKDILICKRIGHCQGEAKGYINLGVLHYRNQRYDEALDCYKRAHNLAKSMEDEDSLVGEIDQNIESAKEAKKIMGELTKEEQNLKKLKRYMNSAKGTSRERNCLLQQNASLDCLIDKARLISLWLKLLEFGKRKKGIASELCDKEKLSDSFMFIGEAYENLRKFSKASKWYTKSWETYKSIGNLEGQAMAQLNIGNVLDSDGNWQEALDAYEECYRIATEAKLDSIQLTALENMNYSHLIRFNNVDKARKYQLLINKLKESKDTELGKQDVMTENYCSESDTEGNIHTSNDRSNACDSPETLANVQEMSDDVPLISLLQSTRGSPKIKPTNMEKQKTSSNFKNFSPKGSSRSISNQDTVGRKRVRVVLSDDEDETFVEVERSKGRTLSYPVEDVATSDGFKSQSNTVSPVCVIQDVSVASKCTIRSCTPVNIEESSSSYKNTGPFVATQNGEGHKSSSAKKNDQCITIKIDKELIHVEAVTFVTTDKLSIESVKVELACLYYLQLPGEKRSEGLFPIIQHIRCGDRVIESLETIETLKDQMGKVLVEAFIDGWVQKRLIKLYIDSCKEISETPNMKLLKKLYDLEVSDDEITVSDCELQDISVTPLLNALHAHKTFAVLDLSHNLLGNVTMEKLQRVFTDSGQKYGGLMLDLHCNRFGPTALFQICECPSLFARLEVLNIAGNRLTDACASYLSTILQNCRALCSLNIEGCSVTSRTFQKVADALDSGSALEQLFVGHNNPLSGNAIVNLLVKLTALKRFSKLSLNGLKLSKPVIDSLGLLAKTSSLSALMLGETGIGTEGALAVTELLFKGSEDSVKLDLSYCGLTSEYILKLNADASIVCCILELNLAGNPIAQQGTTALSSLLLNPQCCLKVLALEKCQLGVAGILQILQALADNNSLEDLNLADNADADQGHALQHDITSKGCTEILQPQTNIPESSPKMCAPKEVEPAQQGLCPENADLNQLQVADSEDEHIKVGAVASGTDDSCTSSCQRNSSPECQLIQELSTAISKAKKLQLLDLSNNGFSTQAAELFAAWSSSRPCPAYRHIKDQIIHLFTEGKKCCIKPCCKKD